MGVEGVYFIPKWLRLDLGCTVYVGKLGASAPTPSRSCCLEEGRAGGGGAVELSAAPTRGPGGIPGRPAL